MGRPSLAALVTLTLIILGVILPLTLITASLVREATGIYQRLQSGELDMGRFFQRSVDVLPGWAAALLERFGTHQSRRGPEPTVVELSESQSIHRDPGRQRRVRPRSTSS